MAELSLAEVPAELVPWCGPTARLSFPTQGMTSDVAFCASPRGDVVLKRCAHARYVEWLRREHVVLEALRDTGLPAPKVLGFVDRGTEVWLALAKLPGISLGDALREADATGRAHLLQGLGGLLRRIHATPVPSSLRDPVPWIDRMLAQAERNLGWCDGTRALLDQLHARRPTWRPETLIHGDLGLDNVLVDEGRVATIVDWPMGGSGDPRFDIAIAIEHDDDLPLDDAQLAAFWAGYGEAPLDSTTRGWFERLWDFF
jgi:aminoglycoside phosphotransferase (APT) family kinase protein